MLSLQKKFVFLHIPKTGGNSIQDALRAYTDEDFVTQGPHQDGVERFQLRNSTFTHLKKHSTLQCYHKALRDDLQNYYIFTTIRNPFDKLVSFYFSPHRGKVEWDSKKFARFARKVRPLEHYLSVRKNIFAKPRLAEGWVNKFVRFESIQEDMKSVCADLKIEAVDLPHRNKSASRMPHRDCFDKKLRTFVEEKHSFEIKLGNYTF